MDLVKISGNAEGQAITEYILLLSVVVFAFMAVARGVGRLDLQNKLVKMMSGSFAAAYQYGHPKVKGPDNGGPSMHPRVVTNGNFRIFLFSQAQ